MAKKKITSVSVTFFYSLAIISILGFAAIIGDTFLNFDFLNDNMSAIILIVLGIGLIVEGQIKRWKSMSRDGISSNELAHIITGTIGIVTLIIGFLNFFGIQNEVVDATKGIVASIAIVVIVVQTWLVE